ncbi:hypothetical protein SLEP1_g34013 [Rubroshorea leprosula]|uniref:Uncharacterized protein n=1 Tax=Rubroshorea leprosula TaxID=152421 RepID=A0AAV5KIL4_9ROSI|nr:hypothetical protein SLEP1_g34013 [Rubroshorea leprosula]
METARSVLEKVFKQLKLANWVEKALNETQHEIEFEEETLLELKKCLVREIKEKIIHLQSWCSVIGKMDKASEQVDWVEKDCVEKALDEIRNKIELEEKTFLKIKEEDENMLEVELNKLQKFSTMEESDRSSLAEESLSELNKKTN